MINQLYIIILTLPAFLLVLLSSCVETKTEEEVNLVEPYSIEFFEVITSPDTCIRICFNREVNVFDVALKINPIYMEDSIHNLLPYQFTLPLTASKNRILEIKYPIVESRELLKLNSLEEIRGFNKQLLLQINGTNPFAYVNLIPDFPNCPNNRILSDGTRLYWLKDIVDFKPNSDRPKLDIKDKNAGDKWRLDYWRYYNGRTDANGKKTGKWIWKYSNGNILATTDFESDTISTVLKIYDFNGELIDSIPAGDKRLNKENLD